MVDLAGGFGVTDSRSKRELEEEAYLRGKSKPAPDDPGEMNDLDRFIVGQRFARVDFRIDGNRFQIRRCAQYFQGFAERLYLLTQRNDLTDRQVALEARALAKALQHALRTERGSQEK